jgi:hypothetical protein
MPPKLSGTAGSGVPLTGIVRGMEGWITKTAAPAMTAAKIQAAAIRTARTRSSKTGFFLRGVRFLGLGTCFFEEAEAISWVFFTSLKITLEEVLVNRGDRQTGLHGRDAVL